MKILSHRGYWNNLTEKNSKSAFRRSFQLGFGTETDVRDLNGELVISHDMPIFDEATLPFYNFLSIYSNKINKNDDGDYKFIGRGENKVLHKVDR